MLSIFARYDYRALCFAVLSSDRNDMIAVLARLRLKKKNSPNSSQSRSRCHSKVHVLNAQTSMLTESRAGHGSALVRIRDGVLVSLAVFHWLASSLSCSIPVYRMHEGERDALQLVCREC